MFFIVPQVNQIVCPFKSTVTSKPTVVKNFAVLSLLCLGFAACDKDDDDDNNASSKTDTLTASAWTYQDAGFDSNRNGSIEQSESVSLLAPGLVQSCRADNVLIFKKDNTGTVDEGATKCNGNDAQTTSFNWSFADNESSVVVSNNVFALLNGKSRIVALTSTEFTLSRDTVFAGISVPIMVKLKH